MIKRWLYYFYILSIVVLIAYLIMIFLYSKENREYVANISSFYLEQQLIEEKYKELDIVKNVLKNEYSLLKNENKKHEIEKIKQKVRTLKDIIESFSLLNKKDFYIFINNYLSKTKLDFELNILNNKKEIIASTELYDIGEKKELKCDPFKN